MSPEKIKPSESPTHRPGSSVTREQICGLARSWIGTPWRHQGRTKDGIDCGGLIVVVGHELGLIHPSRDERRYERMPTLMELIKIGERHLHRKEMAEEKLPGDVVVMRPSADFPWPSHMGIISRLDDGLLGLIHSYTMPGRKNGRWVGGVVEIHYHAWEPLTVALYNYHGVE